MVIFSNHRVMGWVRTGAPGPTVQSHGHMAQHGPRFERRKEFIATATAQACAFEWWVETHPMGQWA
ncbi:hypothetical protein JCM19000A_30840 [Silvimonas sp. JCM 19000]